MNLGVSVPASDALDADFVKQGDELSLALVWAYFVTASITAHSVENAIRALRLIAVNVPDQRTQAIATLAQVEGLVQASVASILDRAIGDAKGTAL